MLSVEKADPGCEQLAWQQGDLVFFGGFSGTARGRIPGALLRFSARSRHGLPKARELSGPPALSYRAGCG